MPNNIIINYVAPFYIANGVCKYSFQKQLEKKVILNFSIKKENEKLLEVPNKYLIPDTLKDYVKIIESVVDNKYLDNLHRNINDVEINKQFKLLLLGIAGKYKTDANKISYTFESSLTHEFLHLASTYNDKNNNIIKSGFLDYTNKLIIGKAFNEGFTELLNKKYFNSKSIVYKDEVNIVKFFDLLFDSKELEKLYFTNDFIGLIKQLNNFMTTEDAIKLISNFDLALDFKKIGNPIYIPIYINIRYKLSKIFKEYNKDTLKQFDYLHLLDECPVVNTIQKANNKLKKNLIFYRSI